MSITAYDHDTLDEVFDIIQSAGGDARKRDEFLASAKSGKPYEIKVGTTAVLVNVSSDSWSAVFSGKTVTPAHSATVASLNDKLDMAYRKFN